MFPRFKTLYAALVFSFFAHALYGQKMITWFDVGIKGQVGASGLYNKAILDASSLDYNLDFSNSYGLGGKLGINWNEIGISIEAMYNSNKSKIKRIAANNSVSFVDHSWNGLDLYPLLRRARNLGYFEIGPKVSLVQNLKQSVAGVNSPDIASQYNDINYGAVLGFGSNVLGIGDAFTGILGIRIEYIVNDFVSAGDGKRFSAPLNIPNMYDQGYKSTHPLFIGLVFEANFGVGYYGRAKCGARSKFMRF
ncbi:MAG TPA: hypothetical protein PKD85_03235 [Saprospiraceae bacterium]|nr:hypothetical protein [Saprospiraceae bacterium]